MKSTLCILLITTLFITYAKAQDTTVAAASLADHFKLDSLKGVMVENNQRWLSFFKNDNVLTGLYLLKQGEEDRQQPHDTDEVYYVIEGKAILVAGGKEMQVEKGSILFVKAMEAHKFESIESDLLLLVFFDQ